MAEKKETFSVAISSGSLSIGGAGYGSTAGGYGVGKLAYVAPDNLIVAPDGHPIYALVGKVASDWAHVEHTLDVIIWDLSGIDHRKGAAITAQIMGAYGRFKAILALLAHPDFSGRKSLQAVVRRATDLMNRSSELSDKRNRIVHDPWYAYTVSGRTAQFKSMPHKDHRYGIQLVDAKVLDGTQNSIREFAKRVDGLKSEISQLLSDS
ncbi:hypothetical protein SAMN05443247_08858 [Bradyrhizobium erythrophlei]|nr:hypothetical protein SAMN05443247_08858 [Bradyrhizobium erythrophlei]